MLDVKKLDAKTEQEFQKEKRYFTVPDYIVLKSNQLHQPVTNLKLQKILYFLNVIQLVESGDALFPDFKFSKYNYGATVEDIYEEYRKFGGDAITKPVAHVFLYIDQKQMFHSFKYKTDTDEINLNVKQIIDKWLPILLNYDQFDLVKMCLAEPQWSSKISETYNNKLSKRYWSKHRFWSVNRKMDESVEVSAK